MIFLLLTLITGVMSIDYPSGVTIHNHYYFCGNTTGNQQSFKDQIDKAPSALQKFIGKKIRIKTPYFNEYLYTDTRKIVDDDRWYVFFDRTKNHNGRKYHWTITPVDSYMKGFALKNDWNTWLYSPVDNSYVADGERRLVFMWIPLDDPDYTGEWVFESVPNSDTNFYIKSKHRDEYLYPLDDGKQSANVARKVYTWIPKLTEFGLQMEWTFELVD